MPVATSAQREDLSGDYQFWILENPDTNSNAVFYNPNATATTTATQSKVVRPGQSAFFFVNTRENPNGVSLIAATGATTVNLTKETFRTRLGYQIGVLSAAVAASVANLWRVVAGSTTAVELNGAYTEARADTLRAKTANGLLDVVVNGTGGIRIGTTNNLANGADAIIGRSTDSIEVGGGLVETIISGTRRGYWLGATFELESGSTFLMYNGNRTDARYAISPTALTIYTPSAGGAISSGYKTIQLPIKSGSVVANADLVIFDPNNANRVLTTTATTDVAVIGQAISGGTGNAGGTVFAEIVIDAVLIGTVTADTGGTTANQYLILGSVTVNQVNSSTVRTNASFGRCLKTAAAGVVVDWKATDVT